MDDPRLENLFRWRRWTSRIALGSLFLGLALIAFSFGMLWWKQAQNRDFHRRVVAPALERAKEGVSNPQEVDFAITAWLDRQQGYGIWLGFRLVGLLVLGGGFIAGIFACMVLDAAINRRLARPERPAVPGAGAIIRELSQTGEPITATAPPVLPRTRRRLWLSGALILFALLVSLNLFPARSWTTSFALLGLFAFLGGMLVLAEAIRTGAGRQSIEIDPMAERITFRHFRFVRHFARNPVRPKCTLRAADILHVEPLADGQGQAVTVRTTQGRVAIFDRLQNFGPVVALLADFAECNRLDPAAFRAALAREPQIETPWWGWGLLLALIASIVGGLWWLVVKLA